MQIQQIGEIESRSLRFQREAQVTQTAADAGNVMPEPRRLLARFRPGWSDSVAGGVERQATRRLVTNKRGENA